MGMGRGCQLCAPNPPPHVSSVLQIHSPCPQGLHSDTKPPSGCSWGHPSTQTWVPARTCGSASLQGHFLPENVPSREQGDTGGQAQGQPILQPAHVQRSGAPRLALQGHRREQDTTDHLRVIRASLDGRGDWAKGQRC